MKQPYVYGLLIALVWITPTWATESHQHKAKNHAQETHDAPSEHRDEGEQDEHEGHNEHEEEAVVRLSRAQQQMANIRTLLLKPQKLANETQAPGEVILTLIFHKLSKSYLRL